jgi:hypothetical protein
MRAKLTSSSFAAKVRAVGAMPVMVTGGFRSVSAMVNAIARGDLDLIGLARPMIADPRRRLAGCCRPRSNKQPPGEQRKTHLSPWSIVKQ